MPLTPHRIRLGPHAVHYEEGGDGPPLVLVHGLSGSSRWWRFNVPRLRQHFHLYVVDLAGFGRSRGRLVLREAAAFLTRWMDHVGLPQAAFVGHSMGGVITADLAACHPERVSRLVLVDAAVLLFERSYLRNAWGVLRAAHRLPLDFWPVLVRDAYQAGPRTIVRAAYELVSTDMGPRLAHVAAPTLVVWGARDTAVPLALGERLVAALPDATLKVLPGAGHNPMWDRPEAFNEAVVSFLLPEPSGADAPPSTPPA